MKTFILTLTLMLCGATAFGQNTELLTSRYLQVKEALVRSQSESAKTAMASFSKTLKAEKEFAQKAKLLKATEKFTKAGSNLSGQRSAFNEVSTLMWSVVKSAPKTAKPVHYQYCSMKNAYWLSHEKEIKNPYYGSSMLACGNLVETKK